MRFPQNANLLFEVSFGKLLAVSRLKAAKHAFFFALRGLIPKNPPFGGGALGRLKGY
jgi:hypothetical protein